MKEIKIKTPYGTKNWSFVEKCFNTVTELEKLKEEHGITDPVEAIKTFIKFSDKVAELDPNLSDCIWGELNGTEDEGDDENSIKCPQCGSADLGGLGENKMMCFECDYEFDEADIA